MTTTIETPSFVYNGVLLSKIPLQSLCNLLGEPENCYSGNSWEIIKDGRIIGVIVDTHEDDNYMVFGSTKVSDLQLATEIMKSLNVDLGKSPYSFSVELKGQLTIIQCK